MRNVFVLRQHIWFLGQNANNTELRPGKVGEADTGGETVEKLSAKSLVKYLKVT